MTLIELENLRNDYLAALKTENFDEVKRIRTIIKREIENIKSKIIEGGSLIDHQEGAEMVPLNE